MITKIYLVENCYGKPNKVYIGKTKTSRKGSHRNKYGSNVEYTVIDEINSFDKKDWKPLETYWIHQFKQWGFDVLNKNEGGGGPIKYSEESKILMKNKWTSTRKEMMKKINSSPKSYIHKKRIGKSIKGQKRSKETCENISRSKIGKSSNHKGHSVSNESKIKMSESAKNKPKIFNRKPVLQLDINKNIINEWESVKKAGTVLGVDSRNISAAARGKQKTAYGYIWEYKQRK